MIEQNKTEKRKKNTRKLVYETRIQFLIRSHRSAGVYSFRIRTTTARSRTHIVCTRAHVTGCMV